MAIMALKGLFESRNASNIHRKLKIAFEIKIYGLHLHQVLVLVDVGGDARLR